MTQDEIMRMAREAGLQPYYDEQVTAIARFAATVAATEREKCTNTQEFVTLPRHVAEHAVASIEMLNAGKWTQVTALAATLRTALEQPQNHVSDAGNMVPAGWKLVPVVPTRGMLDAAHKDLVRDAEIDMMLKGIHSAMLDAAPQPPAVEQPRGEQEPVAWQYRMRPDWRIEKDCWGPWQDCTREQAAMYQRVPLLHEWVYESRQLYTHPQPKRKPLADEQLAELTKDGYYDSLLWSGVKRFARAIEAAHDIK